MKQDSYTCSARVAALAASATLAMSQKSSELIAAGIAEENVSVADICTFKQHDTFFSARRLGISSGRIFTAILLR